MTGPEHYAVAGRLLREASVQPEWNALHANYAAAQVHATLALAAATAATSGGAATTDTDWSVLWS